MNHTTVDISGAMNEKPLVMPTEKLAKCKEMKCKPLYLSPCAEKATKSPSSEESEVCNTENVQICRTLLEEDNAPVEGALGKAVREEPKECKKMHWEKQLGRN